MQLEVSRASGTLEVKMTNCQVIERTLDLACLRTLLKRFLWAVHKAARARENGAGARSAFLVPRDTLIGARLSEFTCEGAELRRSDESDVSGTLRGQGRFGRQGVESARREIWMPF
eukprot:3872892-Pleurochrysis_carterae.AAC.3